jgi:hypothetical protein
MNRMVKTKTEKASSPKRGSGRRGKVDPDERLKVWVRSGGRCRLIQRFSEDVDLIAVLPAGGKGWHDTMLKSFMAGAAAATGMEPVVDGKSTTKGEKRSAVLNYPTSQPAGVLRPGVLIEIGTRGGALPQRRLAVQSLIVEHAESVGLPIDFAEDAPVSIPVLDPVRTLVDKLVLLHHAATEGDDARKAATARHYYDVDRLLRNDNVVAQLEELPVDVLAREVCQHSRAAGMPTADRPSVGFSESAAWDVTSSAIARDAYDFVVLRNLVWPGAPRSTFDDCCTRVAELHTLL